MHAVPGGISGTIEHILNDVPQHCAVGHLLELAICTEVLNGSLHSCTGFGLMHSCWIYNAHSVLCIGLRNKSASMCCLTCNVVQLCSAKSMAGGGGRLRGSRGCSEA